MRPPTGNRITQTSHLSSRAVDYSASPDAYVYAPEDMTFDSYQQRGSGLTDAGNCLRGKGKTGLHQFAHLETTYWKSGKVKKGQKIAKMGHTGYTRPAGPGGTHLHYWVQTPKGYVYPPNLYTEEFKKEEGLVIEEQPPVFNAKYYLSVNPDVKKKYTLANAKEHWKKYGIKEGRNSAPNFHVKEYLANYADLRKAFGSKGYAKAVKHYYNYGINELRSGRKKTITAKLKGIVGV